MNEATGLVSRAATAAWLRLHPGITLAHPEREIPHIELSLRHVPRLAIDKALSAWNQRRANGDKPWITQQAIDILESLLRPTDLGLEFGAGKSTIWFAERCEHVWSVDGFRSWHDPLAARIRDLGIKNVTLTLAAAEELGYESEEQRDAYVNAHPELKPESLDWVLVDGEFRDETARRALDLIRPGGMLILDNANYCLPSDTRARWKVNEPASPLWAEIRDRLEGWRMISTTNGVWDTAIWFKP